MCRLPTDSFSLRASVGPLAVKEVARCPSPPNASTLVRALSFALGRASLLALSSCSHYPNPTPPRRRASTPTRIHTLTHAIQFAYQAHQRGQFHSHRERLLGATGGPLCFTPRGGTPRRRSGTPRTSPIARRACEGARDGSDPSPRFADETDDARAPAGSTLAAHGETLASLTERTRVTARRLSKEIMTSVRRISKEVMDALLLA